MKIYKLLCVVFVSGSLLMGNAFATTILFDVVNVSGTTSFGIDTNGDSIDDLIFSTEDPIGFSHEVINPNLDFVFGDILGVSTSNSPDFRVDFINSISDPFSFAFAFAFAFAFIRWRKTI